MRFLAAIAFLLLGVASAHHSAQHKLRYPQFHPGLSHQYEFTINMTAGVPGLSSQVSKAVIFGEVRIFAKTENELVLRFEEVDVTGSLPGVSSKTEKLEYNDDDSLKQELLVPTYAKYQNGKIVEYSQNTTESLLAQKIRRTVWRNLEVYIDDKYIRSDSVKEWPITYNRTMSSPSGKYKSHYTITVNPFIDFPITQDVYNISRFDNFEGIPYIAYKYHHNFEKQGCPEVCKTEHIENRFGAGCPTGQEPHHGLIKRSFTQYHNLKLSLRHKEPILIFDSVYTKETHLADVYDQDLDVTVESTLKYQLANDDGKFDYNRHQLIKSDLDDLTKEVQESAWEDLCQYPETKAKINEAKRLLKETADIILADDPQSEQSKEVGKNVITIQKIMQRFKSGDFRILRDFIKSYHQLEAASEQEKIIRQLWLDILPTVGTDESVTFIVTHINENINLDVRGISFWESKSVLEALPQNIHHPTTDTINTLTRLLSAKIPEETGYTLFKSAAYMAIARVIRRMCAYPLPEQTENLQSSQEIHSLRNMWKPLSQSEPLKEGSGNFDVYLQCPETAANKFIESVTDSLLKTKSKDKAERVIYIEALSLTGLPQVLPTLRKYVHGNPHDKTIFDGLTSSYVNYLKTSTIFALHNLAGRSPRQVQDMLVPIFFNDTIPAKVRSSAFSVIVKSQPTLALLEQIAAFSWREPSEEVASYVTSTFESFGNSSLPCYQSLSQRIRKVYPQLKRYDGGIFNAKNILLDVFDELTGYGIEKRYDYIPSNESFIPSVFYSSVGYNLGNLKDYVYQFAGNVQGITFRQIYEEVLKRVSLSEAADIPHIPSLFKNVNLVSRDPEPWKAILYQKIFYSTSYYYLDANDFTTQDLNKMFMDLFRSYVKEEGSDISGHFVKLYLPTSFHSKSIFKTLPFPVQFEMKSPLLLSLKFKLTKPAEKVVDHKIEVQPSVYHSHIFVNEILNLGDCKRVGVYYEQKTAFSYPFTATIKLQRGGKLSFSYKVPKLPKTVVSHRSESGTYSGKDYLAPLPSQERKTIKTRPTQFRYPVSFTYFGLPKFTGEIKTEDLPFGADPLPRNWQETALYIHRLYMNSGWRRRSVEIQRVPETVSGQSSDEVEYELNYWRDYQYSSKGGSEANWSEGLKFDDELTEKDTTAYAAEGKKMYEKLNSLSHIKNNVEFTVHHRTESAPIKHTEFKLEYYHTFGGYLHLVHMNFTSTVPQNYRPIFITADYAAGYTNMPNEFKYDQKYRQQGLAVGSIAFCKTTPFLNPAIASKAVFNYQPLGEMLPLDEPVTFEPDTHEECLRDIEEGAPHSPACIKAIREKSIYNHLKMHTVWSEETKEYIYGIGKYVDLAMKNAYFSHVQVSKKPFQPKRETSLRVEATYIDKMTDEPVVDIRVNKPTETVNYTMISAGIMKPLSSIENVYETYAHAYSNNTYPATCSLTGNYVTTYDMKVYHMAKHECSYVLTTHCTEKKKFAVIVKRSPSKVSEIQIYFGEDKIVLKPGSRSSYPVKFNSEQHTLSTLQHVMLNKSALISAQVFLTTEGSSYVQIHAGKAGVKVLYDGKYVKVQVNPRYKGELCGLCSEYNGEIYREFRGPDRCLYLTGEGFSVSSIVGRCGEKATSQPRMCDNEEIQVHWARKHGDSEEDSREGYEPTTKRNIVTSQGNKLCFSTKPVPVCENSAQPTMTESRQVDFHCLPKRDFHARKMLIESKRRILGELETKAVDYSDSIEVAKMC